MTLAAGISYALAAIIGIVVSLDVGGLLISQHREFRDSPNIVAKSISHALLHAFTHSGLFLLYFLVVGLVIPWPIEFIVWIKSWLSLPPINIAEAVRTMLLLSSLIIVIFVWITYAQKIAENHAAKAGSDHLSEPTKRIDLLFLYLIATRFFPGRKSSLFYMALAVAVDMLAITSFIRVFFKTSPDASSFDGRKLPHFEFSASNPSLDPFIFSGLIFTVVLICSLVAIVIARSPSDNRNKRLLRWIRIIEPFFVFWFLSVAVDHLFGNAIESASEYIAKILIGALVAAALTWLLVAYHGIAKIRAYVENGYDKLDTTSMDDSHTIEKRQFGRILVIFFGWAAAIFLFLVLTFFVSHRDVESEFNGIREFVNWGSIIASAVSLLILYIPFRWISTFEIAKSDILHRAQSSDKDGFLGPVNCIAISYFVMVIYIHFSFSGMDVLRVSEEESFFWPLMSLGIVSYCAWVLLWWRSAKAKRFNAENENHLRDHFKRNLGDLIGAFASVVFIWQIGVMIFGPSE